MRQLKLEEIEKLARKKGVRKIAVENFLGTMGGDAWAARMNLVQDTLSYRWNCATVNAIRAGIKLAERG